MLLLLFPLLSDAVMSLGEGELWGYSRAKEQ